MTKDIDEDLIEATIRRVQGQKDAAADAPQEAPAPRAVSPEDDDAIEATIRRVQAQAAAADDASPAGHAELRSEAAEADVEAQIRRVQAAVASARSEPLASAPETSDPEGDLDPIEATIRRVQAQAAAQPTTGDAMADESSEPGDDDDVIAATIRRVQERAADREDEPPVVEFGLESVEEPEDDAIAATIRRVQSQAADREEEPTTVESDVESVDEPEDDAIAAAILRVQQQAASRETLSASGSEPETPIDDDDPIAATIRRVQSQAAARHDESSAFAPAPLPPIDDDDETDPVEQAIHHAETGETHTNLAAAARKEPLESTSWPGRDNRMLGEPDSWEVAARRLEQGLQETQLELRALARRFDALLPALERFVASGGETGGLTVVQPQTEDEDWDDSPSVSSMQFGAPPRPAVLRDPAPQSAAAHQLVEEPAAAGPRLRALDEHGNLNEHLPRQYRITVEDKRRGVDLVPLHRAMQGMQNVKDMSLLSYSNGVAIVSVESIGQIDPDALGEAVARCMSRATKVEVHNEQTMVVKIQEE